MQLRMHILRRRLCAASGAPGAKLKGWKSGNFLGAYPAGTAVKHRPADRAAHQRVAAEVGQAAFDQR